MARSSLLVLAAFLLVGIHLFYLTSGQPVPVGDSFNFSATSPPQCPPGAELKLLHILLNGTAVLAASRDDTGSWKASPSYAERLEPSDSSLVLTNINYNDDGSYALSCSDDKKTIQLEVVESLKEYKVSVNDTVHFSCHAVDEDVRSAWWKKNVTYVVRMYPASRKNTTGDGYNLRASVPTDWFSKRNFTLTLGPVQLQDRGDYICSIQDKHGTSRKFVARLKVQETRNETSPEQPGPFHVNKGMDGENGRHTACVAVAIVVTVMLCALALRSRRSPLPPPPPPPPPQREGAQEDVAVPLVSQDEPGVQTNGLPLNGHR